MHRIACFTDDGLKQQQHSTSNIDLCFYLFGAHKNAPVYLFVELIIANISIMLVCCFCCPATAPTMVDGVAIHCCCVSLPNHSISATLRAPLDTLGSAINSIRLIRLCGFQLHHCIPLMLMIFSQITEQKCALAHTHTQKGHTVLLYMFHVFATICN